MEDYKTFKIHYFYIRKLHLYRHFVILIILTPNLKQAWPIIKRLISMILINLMILSNIWYLLNILIVKMKVTPIIIRTSNLCHFRQDLEAKEEIIMNINQIPYKIINLIQAKVHKKLVLQQMIRFVNIACKIKKNKMIRINFFDL